MAAGGMGAEDAISLNAWISYASAPAEWLLDDGNPPPARVPDSCCVSGESFLAQRERVAAMDRSVALRRVRGALEATDAPLPRGRRERGRGGPEL